MSVPRCVAILGAGEIGSGWAALFASHGAEVRIYDVDRRALWRARAALESACSLRASASPEPGALSWTAELGEAARDAEWIQESLPESLGLKRSVLEELDGHVAAGAIVASSTSTLTASELATGRPYGERMLIAHPLHPVYAVPVVELCAARDTSRETLRRAAATLRALGREPIVVRAELPGLVANRLTAALLREAFDLVSRGAIDAASLDRLVSRGLATGWAAVGPLRTEMVGAGAGGFTAFLERFEAPLAALWASLATWRSLDPARRGALVEAIRRYADVPDAAAHHARDLSAHAAGERAWAETLARILRAAEAGATGPVP